MRNKNSVYSYIFVVVTAVVIAWFGVVTVLHFQRSLVNCAVYPRKAPCEFVFQDKCDEYWPERGTTTTYGHVTVTSQQEEERADFVIRTFILKVKVVRTKMELADLHFPQESNLLSIIKLQKWNDRNWPTCFVLFSSRNFRFYVLYHALCQRVIYFTAIIFLSDTSICQT